VKVGDLIKYTPKPGMEFSPHAGRMGIILRIDKDHFGARQAFKHVGRPRGQCVNSNEADALSPTKAGIRDRVMVFWEGNFGFEYIESTELEVINESS